MSGVVEMPPLYDEETFTPDLIPPWVKKDDRQVIEAAVMLGWKMHLSSNSSVTIISWDDRRKYHFSSGGRHSNSLTRIRRDVVRHGEPSKVLIADSLAGIDDKDMRMMVQGLTLPHLGDEGTVVDHRPELEAEKAERKQLINDREYVVASDSELNGTAERRVISERPMRAKSSEGRGYDSKIAIERLWSDGSTDYKCVECDYTNTKRLSIRGHWNKHSKKTERPRETYPAEIPNAATYAPRKDRVDALAEAIAALLAGGETDAKVIAQRALEWVHEQGTKGSGLAEEREPMTADEVLFRIRSMLDDGTVVKQREEIEELKQRLDDAEELAMEAEARADRAQSTLKALVELASESANEGTKEQ